MSWQEYAFGIALLIVGLILECAIDVWREGKQECDACRRKRLVEQYGPEFLDE